MLNIKDQKIEIQVDEVDGKKMIGGFLVDDGDKSGPESDDEDYGDEEEQDYQESRDQLVFGGGAKK